MFAALNSFLTRLGKITDPYWPYVSMLLHGDGTNAAQNNTFLDGSTNNFTVTRNGNTTQGSFNPFVSTYPYAVAINGGSAYFDGTGDYLTVPDNAAFTLGTNAFTFECWINISNPAGSDRYIAGQCNSAQSSASTAFGLYVSSGVVNFESYSGATYISFGTAAGQVVANTWVHLAWARDTGTNTLRIYVNGVQQATLAIAGATALNDSSSLLALGQNGEAAFTQGLAGYISNFRLVNGTCLYPSGTTFTPPTAPLTAVTNTALLLGMSNGAIYDNTMLNNLETVASAQISTSVFKYGTGSMSFNGTTDYLPTPAKTALAFGAGDFTIECWLYPTVTGFMRFMGQTDPSVLSYTIQLRTSATNTIVAQAVTSNGVYTATSTLIATANAWTHVAFVRDGTTIRLYIGGVQSGTNATLGTTAVPSSTNLFSVGAFGEYVSDFWSGYIDDVRITKGICRYPSGTTFTPPTAAFPNSGP